MARSCYYSYGQEYCNGSSWGNWARWLVLALIILGVFFVFFLFSYVYSNLIFMRPTHLPLADASQPADGGEWDTCRTEGQAGHLDVHQQGTLQRSTTTLHLITRRKPKTINLITTTRTTQLLRLHRTAPPRTNTMAADRTMLSYNSQRTPISHRKTRRREGISCCRRG